MTLTMRKITSSLRDDDLTEAAKRRFQEICKQAKLPLTTFSSAEINLSTLDTKRECIVESTQAGLALIIAAQNDSTSILVEITAVYANDFGQEVFEDHRSIVFRTLTRNGSITTGLQGIDPEKELAQKTTNTPRNSSTHNKRQLKPASRAWIIEHPQSIPHLLRALQNCSDKKSLPFVMIEAANTYSGTTESDVTDQSLLIRGRQGLKYLEGLGYIIINSTRFTVQKYN